MDPAAIIGLIFQYAPTVIAIASAAAAAVPPSTRDSNPAFKAFAAAIDFLALNFGNAKKGPPPLAVMKEVVTGQPAPQRDPYSGV